ncbi:MAG: multifunctional CCA tRNA nucleotidyl transferase/2'3'-cyclic phosphodiesterase/2'nucleotidase/phosphatase [Herminiimonas sp.]|nr:multifunctional CCA tRNA nucleotidyl transferase/2'3'-cyclic phosphodiesterase/2'nucleotidase/phosphatase [Herminiimonas sp.]
MQRFLVGGAVRDRLLGLPVQDRDFVVVGASPQEMVALGYTPVGKDFPVFLHPTTHEEHALARTERKTAPGYRGFTFHAAADVTLEQDLARRDLTINAMAQAEDGTLVDPFDGQHDLQQGILRHVSTAFLEDPVRILRLARFAARFTRFTVAPETAALMRTMVENGEVDALVPERVWQEFSRGLMEAMPSRMLEVLHDCGALARMLPMLEPVWTLTGGVRGHSVLAALDASAGAGAALPVRLAILLQAAGTTPTDTAAIDAVCARLKVPGDCRDLAVMTGREREALRTGPGLATGAVALLERCDALRKPARFHQMLEALALALAGQFSSASPPIARWRAVLEAARSVDAGSVAKHVAQASPGQPQRINDAVRAARVAAVMPVCDQQAH